MSRVSQSSDTVLAATTCFLHDFCCFERTSAPWSVINEFRHISSPLFLSIMRITGHFYFALKRVSGRVEMSRLVLIKWNMLSRVTKKTIVSVFFLIYFFSYTVSPLSFSYSDDSANEASAKTVDVSIKSFHLYLLELVALWVSPPPEQDDDPSSATFLLLKEKRTLVRSEDHLHAVDTLAQNYSISSDYAPPPQLPHSSFVVCRDEPKPLDGFHLLHSGLSPPSARRSVETQSAGISSVRINS